ncbi:TRAP transporter small permease [Azospirillum sp. sgz302134]
MSAERDPTAPAPTARTRVPIRIEEFLAAAVMAVIALITFANVLARYFTDISLAFTEEYSIALMVILTLLGASVAVVKDRHMRITFLADKLPPRLRRGAELFAMLCMIVMFGILTVYGGQMAWDDYRFEVTSPALGVDQWLYTIWLPLLSVVVTLRAFGRLLRIARGEPA